jgi:hypothetical protein
MLGRNRGGSLQTKYLIFWKVLGGNFLAAIAEPQQHFLNQF